MWRELNVIATLSDDQLAQIHAFLLPSESNDNSFSVSSRDNDFSNPETPDNEKEDRSVNAEDEAGVADWSDFDFKPADTYEQDSVRHSGETLISRKENGRWLQHCLIAASGSAELIAVALVQRIVVLEKSAFNESCMDVIAQICVVPTAETGSVYICSLCVLPMGCARKTETSAYDWVSVAVGLSTGYVNFYTERGLLIRTELFSHGPITGMRFSESILPGNQEFVVSSHGTLIVVEGLSLYTALRFAKAEIAKGEVDLEQIAERAEINCMRLKTKLSPDGSEDFAITGSRKISSFEQYVNASLSSLGAKARCRRSALPVYSTYVFCGVNPFISFAWNEDSHPAPSLLSTAINQITSSVVSSIPSWGIRSYLGIGVSKKDLPKRAIPAYLSSSDLPIRSKLEDDGREGERIYPAPPSTHLVAVTDAKARVVLIDTFKRRLLRIWKGYRDARCAWTEAASACKASEKDGPEFSCLALFLVIFAPRRGLLEVWSMQNGHRVWAVNVDRRGRLFSVPRMSELVLGGVPQAKSSLSSAFFISPDGRISQLLIPFHLSVINESTADIHDESLIKQTKLLLESKEVNFTEWLKSVKCMRTVSAIRTSVEKALELTNVDYNVLISTIDDLQEYLRSISKFSEAEEGRSLVSRLSTISQLLSVYVYLKNLHRSAASLENEEYLGNEISDLFKMNKADFDLCIKRIELCTPELEVIEDDRDYSFVSFLNNFDIFRSPAARQFGTDYQSDRMSFELKTLCPVFGSFIFHPLLTGRCTIEDHTTFVLEKLNFGKFSPALLLCRSWLSAIWPASYFHSLSIMVNCFHLLTSFQTRDLLETIENEIINSYETSAALSLCAVTRSIAKDRCSKDDHSSMEIDSHHDWERVEIGIERWDLLLMHLQCMALMRSLPLCPVVSIRDLLSDGHGYYREKIGAWSAAFLPPPAEFHEILSSRRIEDSSEDCWMNSMMILKSLLPRSLQADLAMCDCCWECAGAWNRQPVNNIQRLQSSVEFMALLDSSPSLQHGLALLVWDTFLRQPFRSLAELLNKVNRIPKDRIVVKEVGVLTSQLPIFASCCRKILRILCSSLKDIEHDIVDTGSYEDFIDVLLDMFKAKTVKSKRKPLCVLASIQKPVNYHLVLHHLHLSVVVELEVCLSVFTKPQNLFDQKGLRAFFDSFHSHPLIPIADVEDSVVAKRQKFLEDCLEAMISLDDDSSYWSEIAELAGDWELDIDALRIKRVTALYSHGLDGEAERIIPIIGNRAKLAERLFPIALNRIRHIIDTHGAQKIMEVERHSMLSNRTFEMLKNAAGSNVVSFPNSKCATDHTKQLLRHIGALIGSSTSRSLGKISASLSELERVLSCITNVN